MRPNLVLSVLVLSLAALPALAQTPDRYGASAPRPLAASATAGPSGLLSWAGKSQAAAGSPAAQAPKPLAGGMLASTSILRNAPLAPQPAAPPAPPAPRIAAAAPSAPAAPAAPNAPDLSGLAADGLLGSPPPVRDRQTAGGSL